RENLRDILELDDYHVEVAATAAEAMKPRDWGSLDAVILDRRLPDGTADELLPRLKQKAPGAGYVVVTGHSDVEGAVAALPLGAADYLLKPINPDALRIRLGRLMEHRRLDRAHPPAHTLFPHLSHTPQYT